ncbi:hypothetical protein ABPG74_008033 [Tetrahymena malaccensis]
MSLSNKKSLITDYCQEQNPINQSYGKAGGKQEKIFQKVSERINSLSNNLISKKVEEVLFKLKIFKKNKYLESQGLDKQAIQQIDKQINQSLDFISFFDEIIFLKKAIFMILGKDQLAALKIIGCQDNYFNIINNQQNLITEQDKKANYFQEQLFICQSEELQSQYISQFLEKCCADSKNLSDIDKRIYSSLI